MSSTRPVDRHLVRLLSVTADVDQRTATRALLLGAQAIRGARVRDSIVAAASELHIALGADASAVEGSSR